MLDTKMIVQFVKNKEKEDNATSLIIGLLSKTMIAKNNKIYSQSVNFKNNNRNKEKKWFTQKNILHHHHHRLLNQKICQKEEGKR